MIDAEVENRPPPLPVERRRRWSWVPPVVLLGALAALAVYELRGLGAARLSLRPGPLALAYAIYACNVLGRGAIWHLMMRWGGAGRRFGQDVAAWMGSVLVGRYIPGKVAVYAARLYAYRDAPISRGRLSFFFFLDVAGTLLGTCMVVLGATALTSDGVLASYRLPALGAAAALALATHPRPLQLGLDLLCRLTGRERIRVVLSAPRTLAIVALLSAEWGVLAAGVVALASAVTPLEPDQRLFVAAAFAISHVSGVLAVFAPGGLGVREGVFAALLSTILPTGVASLVALTAGAWVVTAELALLAGLLVSRSAFVARLMRAA